MTLNQLIMMTLTALHGSTGTHWRLISKTPPLNWGFFMPELKCYNQGKLINGHYPMTDKETLEELKVIISNKPDGKATHIDSEGDYCRMSEYGDYQYYNGTKWVESGFIDGIRSLSDIEEIIKLREFIAGLQLSVSDEVKANELLGVDDEW